MSHKDSEFRIALALIDGVKKAASVIASGGSERDVTTFVSMPMWQLWCRFCAVPEDSIPSKEWNAGVRIYGSETHVIEHSAMFAVSFSTQ